MVLMFACTNYNQVTKRRAGIRDTKEAGGKKRASRCTTAVLPAEEHERERDPKGEKKKSSFTDPDLPDSAREAKKNLLLCASDHAWHHGMHLLAAWPGTCLEREREQEKDEEKRKNRLKDARQVVKKLGMAK